jgi:hypothetical protein
MGESKSKVVNGVECIVWRDKRIVTSPDQVFSVLRRNTDGNRSSVPCPDSIRQYNTYMGGVDVLDSMRKTYSCSHKSRKWWLWLYYFFWMLPQPTRTFCTRKVCPIGTIADVIKALEEIALFSMEWNVQF